MYIFILTLSCFGISVFAEEISLGEYQQLFENMEKTGVQSGISSGVGEKRRCVSYDKGTYLAVSPACFLQGASIPELPFSEVIDAIMPYVYDVSAIYDIHTQDFWYKGTDIIFTDEIKKIHDRDIEKDIMNVQLFAHHNMLIQVPKILLAIKQMNSYSFFAATRDTTTYGDCRKQNYDVAMEKLDGYMLAPGEELNMNTLIANLPDYCTGTAGTYMFYQGVCGGSTQLFWNALVNPYIYVVERYAHGEFWQNFYGAKGEDAAIYENSKKLIIENIGTESIYFRTFIGPDGNTVLVSVYPKKEGLRSHIKKEETGKLSAELFNKVTDEHGGVKFEQSRTSRYWGINDTKDL